VIKLSINAMLALSIVAFAAPNTDIYLLLALYCFNIYLYYHNLGGSWKDDYSKSTVMPAHWQDKEKRMLKQHYSFMCRVGMIFGVLFTCSAVVL
jgi:hypothetical protein